MPENSGHKRPLSLTRIVVLGCVFFGVAVYISFMSRSMNRLIFVSHQAAIGQIIPQFQMENSHSHLSSSKTPIYGEFRQVDLSSSSAQWSTPVSVQADSSISSSGPKRSEPVANRQVDWSRFEERPDGNHPVEVVAILGERHSGTNWIYDHLTECFAHAIPIRRRLSRYKHWFQNDNPSQIYDKTLVLVQSRNVYEWTEAMVRCPHHASEHLHLNWLEFLQRPWTMNRTELDLTMQNQTGYVCQENFQYHEIVSCLKHPYPKGYWDGKKLTASRQEPFYEMRSDGSGQPYDNVLQMRADKIRNFISAKNFKGVYDLWRLQYEFLAERGTSLLIEKIQNLTGVEPRCQPFKPKPRRQRLLDSDMMNYLDAHVDWEVEKLIGYKKRLASS